MQLLVLTGLVSIEKRDLTVELAQHYTAAGQRVLIIDNIARLAIDPEWLSGEPLVRLEGDIVPELAGMLATVEAEVVILAASERAHPETLFTALDSLHEIQPDWIIQTLAMIDLRTCDCFPNVRVELERYADMVVMLPYQLSRIVEAVHRPKL